MRFRRLLSRAIYAVLAAFLVATVVVAGVGLRDGQLRPLDLWAGVIPVFLAIVTAVLGPLQSGGGPQLTLEETAVRRAAVLAQRVINDWKEESRYRGLYEGHRMEVRWQVAPGSDRASRLGTALPGSGRLDELTTGYGHHARSGGLARLVVSGDAGAGKTAACVLLTLELDERSPAVPVLFQLSSWDPGTSLLTWMTDELLENYPFLADDAHGRKVAAELAVHHVLPVLDGLDEVRDPAAALRCIEEELAGRSFVLSCRTAAFASANAGRVLHQALIVQLQPLRADEVRGILLRSEPGDGHGNLAALIARLDDEPTGPVAEALQTPFILSLAVALGASLPPELLAGPWPDAADASDAADRIKRYLLGTFVDKAYPRRPEPHADGGPVVPADRARRYLAFMATHADPATGRLAWWRLHLAVPRAVFLTAAVLNAAVICSALAAGLFALVERPWLGFWIGLAAGVTGAFVVELVPQDDPRRARPRLRSVRAPSLHALLRTLGFGLMGSAACAAIVWFMYEFPHYAVIGGALSGLTFAAARYISEPSDPMQAVTPDSLLSTDRAAVVYAWLAGAVPGGLTGAYLGASLRAGHRTPELDHVAVIKDLSPVELALTGAAGGCVLSAAGLGLMAFGSSSWGRFVIARVWLAARGSAPLRLMTFLRGARGRGMLRQVNGYYEFRHRLLQRHLAEPGPGTPAGPGTPP